MAQVQAAMAQLRAHSSQSMEAQQASQGAEAQQQPQQGQQGSRFAGLKRMISWGRSGSGQDRS